MLFTGGTIRTLDPASPVVERLGVRDGLIAVEAAPGAQTIDLGSRCVLPGFTDSHVHFPTWSAKTPEIDRKTGDFYLFGNDIARGRDIYHYTGAGKKPKSRGKWMNAQEARVALAGRPTPGVTGTTYICLLDD